MRPMEQHQIFIANLNWQASEDDLRALIAPHGEISRVRIVRDRETNNSKGMAFADAATADDVKTIVAALDGTRHLGRQLRVEPARPRG